MVGVAAVDITGLIKHLPQVECAAGAGSSSLLVPFKIRLNQSIVSYSLALRLFDPIT